MADPVKLGGATGGVDKQGIVSLVVQWEVDTFEEAVFFVPENPPGGLPIVQRPFKETENGMWIVDLHYEGFAGVAGSGNDLTAELETYEIDYASSESPIEAFKRFTELADRYNAVFDPAGDKNAKFDYFKKLLKDGETPNPAYGISHFFDPSAVWRTTRVERVLPVKLFKNLGKIDTPVPRRAGVYLPTGEEGANWLKKSVKASLRGNVWQTVTEWLLSGEGGWLPDLYQPRA